MKKSFKLGVSIVAVGILVAGVVASMNFGAMSAVAQTTYMVTRLLMVRQWPVT
ncbi:MAG: hypothetical protein WAJ93_06795 [Candidatus Nitrosopolaris sp.]